MILVFELQFIIEYKTLSIEKEYLVCIEKKLELSLIYYFMLA